MLPINQDQLLSCNAKVCVNYHINDNVATNISDFQQKYVEVKAKRRSGGTA